MALGRIDIYRRKGVTTIVQIPGIMVTTGATGTGATWTVTGGGGAIDATIALGAVNGGTTVAEDGATGFYNLTINSADNANEKSVFKCVPNTANMQTIMVVLNTVQYLSHLNITSATAAQNAVTILGNTTGAGISTTGGASGQGIYAVGGATAGVGFEMRGHGSNGNGMLIGSDSSTTGFSGAALEIVAYGSNDVCLGINAAGATNSDAVRITGKGSGPAILATGGTTGAGAKFVSGAGATGNGMEFTAGSTNGSALKLTATGSGVELLGSGNAELAAIPGATPTTLQMLQFLYEYARNKDATTLTLDTLYMNDGSTPLGTAAISSDGTTTTKARMT
jgi:hypothetical protein